MTPFLLLASLAVFITCIEYISGKNNKGDIIFQISILDLYIQEAYIYVLWLLHYIIYIVVQLIPPSGLSNIKCWIFLMMKKQSADVLLSTPYVSFQRRGPFLCVQSHFLKMTKYEILFSLVVWMLLTRKSYSKSLLIAKVHFQH